MGYTHYWGFSVFVAEKSYKKACAECRKIIKASPVELGGADGTGKPKLTNGFMFNGVGDNSHETFGVTKIPEGELCKTERKPYDVVVVACLCAMQECLGKSIDVTSDGDPHEWEEGKALAEKVLKREIKMPQGVIDQLGMYGWAAKAYREKHPEYEYTPLDKSHPNHKTERVPDYAKS